MKKINWVKWELGLCSIGIVATLLLLTAIVLQIQGKGTEQEGSGSPCPEASEEVYAEPAGAETADVCMAQTEDHQAVEVETSQNAQMLAGGKNEDAYSAAFYDAWGLLINSGESAWATERATVKNEEVLDAYDKAYELYCEVREQAFTDGYNQGNSDGYGDGYRDGYLDAIAEMK